MLPPKLFFTYIVDIFNAHTRLRLESLADKVFFAAHRIDGSLLGDFDE